MQAQLNGYDLLVPVPSDLPVMVDVALSVLKTQHSPHRRATIVIPDRRSAVLAARVESYRSEWDGPLSLVDLAAPEQALLPRLNDPARNHPAQLIRGATRSRASHVIFHDADLFPLDKTLHEQVWASCLDPSIDVCGVEGPWDPWYAAHDRGLVATWEMCCRVDWLRSFAPWRHFGHETRALDEMHIFDTTFFPQWNTPQERLRVLPKKSEFVHFNYVISTYRKFQGTTGPFRDTHFRLLLLRMLIDTFGTGDDLSSIPSLADLESGLRDAGGRVFYDPVDAHNFRIMISGLRAILAGPWVTVETEPVLARLEAFEDWARVSDEVEPV